MYSFKTSKRKFNLSKGRKGRDLKEKKQKEMAIENIK